MIRDIAPRRRVAAAVVSLVLAVAAAPLLALNALRARRRAVTRVLVIEPWGIGDLVLATGALRSCRAAFPSAHITVLAKAYAEPIVVSPEMADAVVAYDFPWTAFTGKYRLSRYRFGEIARLIWRLRRERYDLVLNARADVRNNLLGALVGGRRFVSARCGLGDFLATDVVSMDCKAHRVEDWARVLEQATGAPALQVEPCLTINGEARRRMRAEIGLAATGGPVIGIHPGAATEVRRWDASKFARVAEALASEAHVRIVVFAEPNRAPIPVRKPAAVVQHPLNEMMAALACCDILICNDSGPMHLASALGIPVVALFGPGQVEWCGPRGGPSRIVRINDMPCRPCFDACRFATPHCMTRLSEDDVIASAIFLLSERGLRHDYSLSQLPAGIRM